MKRKLRKILAILLILTLFADAFSLNAFANSITNEPQEEVMQEENVSEEDIVSQNVIQDSLGEMDTQRIYNGENYRVIFTLEKKEESGHEINVKIENTGEHIIENWYLSYDLNSSILDIWNAEIYRQEQGEYIVKNAGWNQDIPVGGYVDFGFIGNGQFTEFPLEITLVSTNIQLVQDEYEIDYQIFDAWKTGFTGNVTINNKSDKTIEDWQLSFHFENEISNIWNAEILTHEGDTYTIKNAGWNQNIAPNSSITFGFQVDDGNVTQLISNPVLEECSIKTQEREPVELEDIGEAYFKDLDKEDIVRNEETGIMYVRNQLLISALIGTPKNAIEQIVEDVNAEIVGFIELTNDYQIQFRETKSENELMNLLSYLDSFSFISKVSLNTVIECEDDITISDAGYKNDDWNEDVPDGRNWGLEALKIPSVWDSYYDNLQSIRVGIIDGMFDTEHEDLKNVFGIVFNNPENISDDHGTHVAGIMAAEHNSTGIAGVIKNATLYGYATGGKILTVMQYKYAFANLIGNHVRVINVSQHTGHDLCFAASKGVTSAINAIESNADILEEFLNKLIISGYDFVIVTSAGNVNNIKFVKDSNARYGYRELEDNNAEDQTWSGGALAYYNNFLNAIDLDSVKSRIIVVGSVGHSKTTVNDVSSTSYYYASSSNIGERVDVCAPGVNIYSCAINSQYKVMDGTSMAAPQIAGLVGLLYQINPSLTPSVVKRIICDNTRTVISGYKLPDALKCVQEAVNTPADNNNALLPSGILTGLIKNNKDEGLKNVKITAYRTSVGESNLDDYYTTGSTDKNGNYELVLTQGTYNLNIHADGYLPCFITSIEIKPDQTTYMENIFVAPWITDYLSSFVNGKIINALNGNHISDAYIRARKGWNNKSGNYVTDIWGNEIFSSTQANGEFEMSLPIGIYTVEIIKGGYVTGYYNVVSTSDLGTQTMVLTPVLSDNEYRIVLTWGATPKDLDSHLTYYQGEEQKMHVYYSNKTGKMDGNVIAKLDLDDTSSYGPETVTITVNTELLNGGIFKYSVHDYTNRNQSDTNELSMSGAVVRVYKGNDLSDTFVVPQNIQGTVWHVFDIIGNEVIPINEFTYESSPALVE